DEVDAVCAHYYRDVVGPYWPPERTLVEQQYRGIEFPLPLIDTPQFHLTKVWRIDELLAYLRSWSATQRYMSEQGSDPLEQITTPLQAAWSDAARLEVRWPLTLKLCRNR
ncbi:MAG: SAM-dependent methyltransferase, partial [Gammaproteobacteria bacterium]